MNDLLRKPYDREVFLAFLRESFLPDDAEFGDEKKSTGLKYNYITGAIELCRIGSIGCTVIELHHVSDGDPRVGLSRDTFRLMSEFGIEKALVAFVSPNSANWRFSLVTIDLAIGDGKIQKTYSNPRRYSYYMGPDAKTRTPELYLGKKGRVKDFDDLKGRFSVEVVNREFYREIALAFTRLAGGTRVVGGKTEEFKGVLKLPSKASGDPKLKEFSVRLIGRLIFCWFLKKKLSNNKRPLIPESLLSSEKAKTTKDYYHEALEPLFFRVLNTPMHERDAECRKGEFAGIPFLNGGLFDPHVDDYYGKPSYRNMLKIPDEWFVDLFAILETYNFTIDENTTVDVDLSIDPEMLGRIFENLLAEINPETEETARKATGSYYTPRAIVDYMVNESLSQYLKSKTGIDSGKIDALLSYEEEHSPLSDDENEKVMQAFGEIRIIDPACGSGAFPIGVMQRMVLALQKADPDSKKWLESLLAVIPDPIMKSAIKKKYEEEKDVLDFIRKLGIIRQSIFGIDIQPIAVEIAKLRCFLSLVVEENVVDEKDNRNIEPLPNLDFKFVCANALIDAPEVASPVEVDGGVQGTLAVDTFFERLENLIKDYFHAYEPKQKRELHANIESLIDKKVDEKERELRNLYNGLYGKKKLSQKEEARRETVEREQLLWESYKNIFNGEPVGFFSTRYFFPEAIGGFDVVIANPPYLRADSGEDHLNFRKQILSSGRYNTLWEKWDLYIPFIELGYMLLKPGGIETMIVSDAYCHSKYAEKSQKWFLENAKILRLDFLSEIKIFDAAVRNITFFFQKANGDNNVPERRLHKPEFGKVALLTTDKQDLLDNRAFFPGETKVILNGIRIEQICYISKGMVVNADEKIAQGAFELHDLVSDNKDKIHQKPFVEGKHLAKWLPLFHKWLEWGTERAPALFSRPTFPQLYTVSEKLISVDMAANINTLRVCYDNNQLYHNHSAWSFVPWHLLNGVTNNSLKKVARYRSEKQKESLPRREELEKISARFFAKYLLAIMNSSVARYFLRSNRRSNIHLYPDDWKNLPIPDVDAKQQKQLVALVDKILDAKQKNPDADVSALEREIDLVVYRLYGLTDEEIRIVEGAT